LPENLPGQGLCEEHFERRPPVDNTMFAGVAAILVILFGVFVLAATAFWLWMLVDALTNETDTDQKILWFLVIFFLHFIGAIIYFAVRKSGSMHRPNVK